jgi:hypothetical protein
MPATDTDRQATQLGAKKSARGRPQGHSTATIQKGRAVPDALADGAPLNYLAACSPGWVGVAPHGTLYALNVETDSKTLRRWLKAADEADGRATPRRSSSPAVAEAIRRYHAHSAPHRERYQYLEGSALARRAAPPKYWASLDELMFRRAKLERAMAKASRQDASPP